jgi:hypothetical protein
MDAGYTVAGLPLSPRLGLKADAISGDGNLHDNRLGTFYPLFPKLPYITEANLVTPANILDLQPNITLELARGVSAKLGWNPLWKESKADAFYAPTLSPQQGTAGTSGRFIGHQTNTSIEWEATEHLTIAATYVHFTPRDAVKPAGAVAGDFVAAWAQFRF